MYDWRNNRFTEHYLTEPFLVNPFAYFQGRFFADPVLEREVLIPEIGNLQPAGEGRWVWHNPHGSDEDRIAEFLKGIWYEADWPANESHERIVVTRTWVNGASTSSWTVLQLIGTGELAGQDTIA